MLKFNVQCKGLLAMYVDGHDVEDLLKAFKEAENTKGNPTALVCN